MASRRTHEVFATYTGTWMADRANPDALIVPGHDMAHWQTLAARYD